jgi:ankyrin repeat protein
MTNAFKFEVRHHHVKKNGHILGNRDMYQALNHLSGQLGSDAMNWAAMNGHLEIVKWLHTNRTEGCAETAMKLALENSHLEIIEWLHASKIESDMHGCG